VLTLRELRRTAQALDALLRDARLRALAQTDEHTVYLRFHAPGEGEEGGRRHEILLSCHPGTARVSRAPERPPAPAEPPAFAQLLRARLDRAGFVGARILGEDRQLALRFEGREGVFELVLSILGPRSNLYLLDADGVLRGALRPLSETRRDLALGEPWRSPGTKLPVEGEDRFAAYEGEALLDAIEACYGPAEREAGARELAHRLAQILAKERKRLERRAEVAEADARAGEEAALHHRHGELLKSVLSDAKPGASEVVARDFASGEPVAIPLDPKLSAAANLERLFKRYHKAVARATAAGGQLAELEERRASLAALAGEIERVAADPEALAALCERDDVKRLLARYAPQPPPEPARERKRGEVPARLLPKRYRASGGLEIWVGKSDEANDYLTTRLARGKDLFFHLEGEPGSHVILRTGGRDDPPPEALLEACELAVHFSKQRKASRASVHVVPIRNVKKPKGAKPGLVYVTGGKTIQLRRDPARLARVLDALIPEEI
jgi:predicted ribosome quality control (RQC) complex YloA/Tae2 family protein